MTIVFRSHWILISDIKVPFKIFNVHNGLQNYFLYNKILMKIDNVNVWQSKRTNKSDGFG